MKIAGKLTIDVRPRFKNPAFFRKSICTYEIIALRDKYMVKKKKVAYITNWSIYFQRYYK